MDICPKCNKVVLSDYKFCPKCGYSLTGQPAPVQEPGKDESSIGSISFFNVAQELSSSSNLDELLSKISHSVEDILNADRSSVMLLDGSGKNLYFKSASGEDILKKLKVPLGKGIAGWIAQNRKSEIVNDPYNDERFCPDTDKKTGYRTNSIIGVPMIANNNLIGVVEAINKKSGDFTKQDLDTLTGFAGLAAVIINSTLAQTDQKNTFSNMMDFMVMGIEALGTPEPTPKGHSWNMARHISQIGEKLGLPNKTIQKIHRAALLHDIGFLGAENPKLVGLNIDIDLTPENRYRLHPLIGGEMVKGIKMLKELKPIIAAHHRYRDGTGFPENIPTDTITPEIEIISILEYYYMAGSKEKVDPAKFSPQVYKAFSETIT
ncbi:MAG: GAF domain-containing protein [Elusimicrobia bacterium]|jgi:putative methionine-R-sulfoxide reductase with GAF domain|nr:GAF domain-containing protein [Elusimicrobiota bacterium]